MIISRKKIVCLVLAIISTIIYGCVLSRILGSFEQTMGFFKPFFYYFIMAMFFVLYEGSVNTNRKLGLYSGIMTGSALLVITSFLVGRNSANNTVPIIMWIACCISMVLFVIFGGLAMSEENKSKA